MRPLQTQLAGFVCAAILQAYAPVHAADASAPDVILPAPARVDLESGTFTVDSKTPVVAASSEAAWVAGYFNDLMRRTRGLLLAAPKPSAHGGGISFALDGKSSRGAESYELTIGKSGIAVRAHTQRGLLYGAMSLFQLLTADTARTDRITLQATHIEDAPRYAWRGLMLDSARHYQSPEFIERFIDAMAQLKLNTLHWHLTDDQAWRLEIKQYPRLTDVGAWRVPAGAAPAANIDPATGRPRLYGGFYSQETVRHLVTYAAQRGITIVPEIDMPGHATAAIVAYPEIGVTSTPPAQVPADWGIYTNLYNVDETTFKFIYTVLDEVLALFPSKFVHVGGDEAVKDQWKASPRVQARMRELGISDEAALQSYFVRRLEEYLSRRGRRLIGWDEILEGGIAPGATVMSWRGVEGARKAALAGHDAVLAADPTLYFDHRQSDSPTDPPGRGSLLKLEDVYKFDPGIGLTDDQARHVLGLQGNIWTEHIRTEDRVAFMAFPRAAAVAEVGWSKADKRDWQSFRKRVVPQIARAQAVGIRYSTDEFDVRPVKTDLNTRSSRELNLCTDKLSLALEDDAPIEGPRAVFLIDIMNPCWIYPEVDLTNGATVSAFVGQLPFNFQIGADAQKIVLHPPQTPAGELEVRLGCEGERVATLPLAPAAQHYDVTELPTARISPHAGKHDLCFTFTQKSLDPMWALDKVRVEPVKR